MTSGMGHPSPNTLYGGADPSELPAYPLAEVAHFLWVTRAKLGRWATGYSVDGVRQPAVIRVADRQERLLSFNNLTELHVLSALRHHDVPLQRIRRAVLYLRRHLIGDDHPHPLLALELQTDGLNLFIEHLGTLVNITRYGQMAMRQVFEAHLQRIERDPNHGTALRLFPFVRPPASVAGINQPRAVTIDPLVSFGRPVIVGTRVPTVELANRFSAGEPIGALAEDLGLEATVIEEAIRYQLATRAA